MFDSTQDSPPASIAGNYFQLRVQGLKRDQEDDFTEFCFHHGAEGVAENLKFDQSNLVYEPDVIETEIFEANVYFAARPEENFLLNLQARFPAVQAEMSSEENRDWMHEWKKGFKPFLFSKPFWIVPSWFELPNEIAGDPSKALLVDPGMAFGTGTHETTRLAADLIIEEVTRSRPSALIDVGTGTAILALVASRLGVEHVVGLDNDPEARRTARENLEHNTALQIEIPERQLEDESTQYDVVVANIIDGVLTLLAADLVRILKPAGRMVLSGVLVEREASFYADFVQRTGLRLIKKISAGEWSAALLEKTV